MFPGTANTSRPGSMASFAAMADPLYCAPSTTITPTLIPEMMRLRTGKLCGNATAPIGNSERSKPRVGRRFFVLARIDHVDAAAEGRNGVASSRERASVRGRVDAARHAARDCHACVREVGGKALGHCESIRRRTPRARRAERNKVQQ